MFVQVIQGQVADAEQARAAFDQWARDLAPGATGWLGSTAGVTEDGRFIALARFESEEAAREGERKEPPPELQAQTEEMAAMSIGEPEFFDLRQPWFYSPR